MIGVLIILMMTFCWLSVDGESWIYVCGVKQWWNQNVIENSTMSLGSRCCCLSVSESKREGRGPRLCLEGKSNAKPGASSVVLRADIYRDSLEERLPIEKCQGFRSSYSISTTLEVKGVHDDVADREMAFTLWHPFKCPCRNIRILTHSHASSA